MDVDVGLGIALIVVLGTGCLWLASRLRIPAIIPLLLVGVVAGPATGVLVPSEMFGDALFPTVSLAVGLLLFDGGLSLRWDRLEHVAVVVRLVTVGALITLVVGALASWALLDLPGSQAVLLGAILVVSGPTVVLPILQQVKVRDPARTVLRWEGIVIDPIGATLAVLVLNVVLAEEFGFASSMFAAGTTVAAGIVAGLVGAWLLVATLRYNLVPSHLHVPVAIGLVVLAYEAANLVQPEAGLFATTVMGVVAANQRRVPIGHIVDFGESLGQLLLALLFVVLGASLNPDAFATFLLPSLGLVLVLVVVARPLAVLAATLGTEVPGRQRAFLAWMAPRGIVAAAVAAVFSLELELDGHPAEALAPATFTVIICTVVLYGLTSRPMAKRLKLEVAPATGLVVVGTPEWALELGEHLAQFEVPLMFVATSEEEADHARARGFLVYAGEPSAEALAEVIDSVGAGQVVAADTNDEFNRLALESLARKLERANLYWLPAKANDERVVGAATVARGQAPFTGVPDQEVLNGRLRDGWSLVAIDGATLTERDMPLVAVGEQGLAFRLEPGLAQPDAVVLALREAEPRPSAGA